MKNKALMLGATLVVVLLVSISCGDSATAPTSAAVPTVSIGYSPTDIMAEPADTAQAVLTKSGQSASYNIYRTAAGPFTGNVPVEYETPYRILIRDRGREVIRVVTVNGQVLVRGPKPLDAGYSEYVEFTYHRDGNVSVEFTQILP